MGATLMRAHLERDFEHIDHLDLHGDRLQNPKISGTSHNVFGIQLGVGITLAVKKKGANKQVRYHRVPEMWRRGEKLEYLVSGKVPWRTLIPDAKHTWLVPAHGDEYGGLLAIKSMFALQSLGLNTNRDEVVFDFDRSRLTDRVQRFILDYNVEVDSHRRDATATFAEHLKWSSRLKECLQRGKYAVFDEAKIRPSLYRPFTKKSVYFDSILNQRTGRWAKMSGPTIGVPGPGNRKPFGTLMSDMILPLDLAFEKVQCFPLSHLKDAAVVQFRQHYSNDSITKEDVFHYLYGLLHHPAYRERYAASLKRELPRIPFAPDFNAFAIAGAELARLHVEYELLEPYPLQFVEDRRVPYSERVMKMKLSTDRQSLRVNESLTLPGFHPVRLIIASGRGRRSNG